MSKLRKNKELWNDADTKLLITVWALYYEDLRGAKRNRHVYESIRIQLLNEGVNKTTEAVRIKIQNLSAHFRKEKREHEISGSSQSSWPFYDGVKAIVSGRHVLNDSFRAEEYFEVSENDLLEVEISEGSEVDHKGDQDHSRFLTSETNDELDNASYFESVSESSVSQEKKSIIANKELTKVTQQNSNSDGIKALEIIAEEIKRSNEILGRFEERSISLMERLICNQEKSLALLQVLTSNLQSQPYNRDNVKSPL